MNSIIKRIKTLFKPEFELISTQLEELKILTSKGIIEINKKKNSSNIHDYEFKIFSQWGDDGIIQFLIDHLSIKNKTFIEFGVQDYSESNTRFLLMNNNWSGLIMDGSKENIEKIKSFPWFWKHDLNAEAQFIKLDNVNQLLSSAKYDDLGLLHIDIDGVDYWIWEKINIEKLNPTIVIIEYNSTFGIDKSLTVPYDADFVRSKKHHSNLYYGASLKALVNLSLKKGYVFIGCNSNGNNAYFIKKELQTSIIKEINIKEGFVDSKFRESRNEKGELTYLIGEEKIYQLKGMPIFNLETNLIENI
jgi:hypothetical protein